MSRILLLIFGIFCCSTAVLMIKASRVDPILLSALRLAVAVIALTPLFLSDLKKHRDAYSWRQVRATLLPGAVLAAHFISWIIGARMTPAANSTLIVNFIPIVMPFMLLGAVGERLTRNEWLATAIALIGVLLLVGSDFNVSAQHFWGDVICFGSMLAVTCYLVLGRRNAHFPSLWLYVVPLYAFSAVCCAITWLIFGSGGVPGVFNGREILLVLGLGLIPTVMGHSILNISMKHLRGQVVSIINMGQFIFAGVLAFLIFREIPHWSFYAAGALIVGGAILALLKPKATPIPMKEEEESDATLATANRV